MSIIDLVETVKMTIAVCFGNIAAMLIVFTVEKMFANKR
jgi:homoserine trans-succinylase